MCKWLKNLFKHCSGHFVNLFKPIENALEHLNFFNLKIRLIEAFPVKVELQIVDGYVYRHGMPAGGAARFLINHVDHVQHVDHIQHVDHVQHVDRIQHVDRVRHVDHIRHVDRIQHVDHIQHVDNVQRQRFDHVRHQHVDHVQHVKHGQHFEQVHHKEEDALPTGEKDDNNQIIPFLKFLFIFTLSILRVSSRSLKELRMFKLFYYIFMRALKSESGVYCRFKKYFLKTVRAIKSGAAARFLDNWVVLGKNMREVVCVVGWVWGMGTKKFFQLGKCFESFVNTSIFSGSSRMSKASK